MSQFAISVDGLGKRYEVGRQRDPYGRLTESLMSALRAPIDLARGRKRRDAGEWMWALRDVSFDVSAGDVVGFIGRNGAGKTTLLKVLSRITEPTTGSVVLRGRVGALLEVGTGFHPELTGRENVFMSSAVYGMTRSEIARKFDEIVDFAGPQVERFLDTPVKRYSSGMQVRLGFAVAAHLEPEILIVDEVLAVGDAAFQKKCLGKMGEVAHEGRTVLLVSHNMSAVQTLCGRAIWIDQGSIVEDGDPGDVIPRYLNASTSVEPERVWVDSNTAPGNEHVRMHRALVRPAEGAPGDAITRRTPIILEFEYWKLSPEGSVKLILEVYNQQHVFVIHTASIDDSEVDPRPQPKGLLRSACVIPAKLLNTDTHTVTLRFVRDEHHLDLAMEEALVFEVVEDTDRESYHKWLGVVRPDLEWRTELVRSKIEGPDR